MKKLQSRLHVPYSNTIQACHVIKYNKKDRQYCSIGPRRGVRFNNDMTPEENRKVKSI